MFSSHLSSVVLSHPSNNCFTWIFEFFFLILFPISFVVDFISTCQLWIFLKFALCPCTGWFLQVIFVVAGLEVLCVLSHLTSFQDQTYIGFCLTISVWGSCFCVCNSCFISMWTLQFYIFLPLLLSGFVCGLCKDLWIWS